MKSRKIRSSHDEVVGDAPAFLSVKSLHKRVSGLKPQDWHVRPSYAQGEPALITEDGLLASPDQLEKEETRNQMEANRQYVRERALLFQCEAHHDELVSAGLELRQALPESFAAGAFGENVFVGGSGNAHTLCIGDVLEIRSATRNLSVSSDTIMVDHEAAQLSRVAAEQSSLRLQVSSPRLPCAKVDQMAGKTWGAKGVRAYAARTGLAGWFVKVLAPGELRDGDELHVVERPYPQWTLRRVSELLYGLEGVCDKPGGGYSLPGVGTDSGGTKRNARGGGRREIERLWRGTFEELRELATLPELATIQWRDEFGEQATPPAMPRLPTAHCTHAPRRLAHIG
jgi:MOSC domain-containing protein YiiM